MGNSKNLYYAVNGSGQGCVFTAPPERNEHFRVWCGEQYGCFSSLVMQMESEGFALPALNWKDEPVMLEVGITVKKAL